MLASQALEAEPPLAEEGGGFKEVPPEIGMKVTFAMNPFLVSDPFLVSEESLVHFSEREFAELVQLLRDVEGGGWSALDAMLGPSYRYKKSQQESKLKYVS